MLSTLGARSFYAAAPTLWNRLPANIQEITSPSIFKKKLKTHLFNLSSAYARPSARTLSGGSEGTPGH